MERLLTSAWGGPKVRFAEVWRSDVMTERDWMNEGD